MGAIFVPMIKPNICWKYSPSSVIKLLFKTRSKCLMIKWAFGITFWKSKHSCLMLLMASSTGMFVYELLKSMVNRKMFFIEMADFQKFNKTQTVIKNGIEFRIKFLQKMSDEYRSWSKNLFVTSNNRTPHWRIFKNFPNNVKVWYNILSFAILFIKKVSISVFESFKYIETSNNCLLHSLITSDLSAFTGPRFLSVSMMMWILFFSVTNL